MFRMLALACAFALLTAPVLAQLPAATPPPTPPSPPYGPPITLDQAKRAMAAAELEASKNSWQVAITILDSGGNLVMFHKIDNTQLSAVTTSEGKARTALEFKLPSKALDDAIAKGGAGMRLLALKDITPLEGGVLIMVDGKIIGAIGVSGTLSSQDAQVAKAGADAAAR
jgi:uncharacterized protein GlcG (DUF336 family)